MLRRPAVMAILACALLCLAIPAVAATVQVNQIGTSFQPNDITINVGDTVEWVWSGGIHTVTSGTGSADPNVGSLFDDPLAGSNFSYTFNSVGDFDYFCRPHELFDMKGIVRVQATGIPTLSEWALIVLSALLLLGGLMVMRRRQVHGQLVH